METHYLELFCFRLTYDEFVLVSDFFQLESLAKVAPLFSFPFAGSFSLFGGAPFVSFLRLDLS